MKFLFLAALTFLGTNVVTENASAQAESQVTATMKMAIQQMREARAWEKVNVVGYDCSLPTVVTNNGKCTVDVEADGLKQNFKASPEVAAPWGNGYGSQDGRPTQSLTLSVYKGEILKVKDSKGNTVTTKFDYSR